MHGRLSGPGSASLHRAADPWDGFSEVLTGLVRRANSSGAVELTAPTEPTGSDGRGGRGCCRVQLSPAGPGWVTARPAEKHLAEEMVAWSEAGDPAVLSAAVVRACRDLLGVPHPQLLTLRAEGPVSAHTGPLRLLRTDCVPIGDDPADYPSPVDVAVDVLDHVDARERYEAIIERVTGRPCVVDDAGRLVFDHDGCRIHVEFARDDPHARIWAWVVRGVRSRSDAALEVARRNLGEGRTSWILDGRHVAQRTVVPVAPFLPRHAQFALEHFLYTFASTHATLARTLGSR